MSDYVGIVSVEILRLPISQHGISSASFDTAGVVNVGLLIASSSSSRIFYNIFEYFHFLGTVERQVVMLSLIDGT